MNLRREASSALKKSTLIEATLQHELPPVDLLRGCLITEVREDGRPEARVRAFSSDNHWWLSGS